MCGREPPGWVYWVSLAVGGGGGGEARWLMVVVVVVVRSYFYLVCCSAAAGASSGWRSSSCLTRRPHVRHSEPETSDDGSKKHSPLFFPHVWTVVFFFFSRSSRILKNCRCTFFLASIFASQSMQGKTLLRWTGQSTQARQGTRSNYPVVRSGLSVLLVDRPASQMLRGAREKLKLIGADKLLGNTIERSPS